MHGHNNVMNTATMQLIRAGLRSPHNIITYIGVVKTMIFRLITGVVVSRMALMVKRSLDESQLLALRSRNNDKGILAFILFPVFNSVLFLGHDITLLVYSFNLPYEYCVHTVADITVRDDFSFAFSASIFFIRYLFNNCLCYTTVFKLREFFCCKRCHSEDTD